MYRAKLLRKYSTAWNCQSAAASAKPLRDGKGRKVGVFGADVSLDWLHQQLQEMDEKANTKRIGIGNDSRLRSYTFIVDRDGTYIVHPDKKRILKDKFTAIDFSSQKQGSLETELDGQEVLVCYEDLHNTGWTIGFVVHRRIFWLPVIVFGIIILVAMLAGLLAVYITSRFTIRRSTKPLQNAAVAHPLYPAHPRLLQPFLFPPV